jgi:hypothetical protein
VLLERNVEIDHVVNQPLNLFRVMRYTVHQYWTFLVAPESLQRLGRSCLG